jgi:hypothetical protein
LQAALGGLDVDGKIGRYTMAVMDSWGGSYAGQWPKFHNAIVKSRGLYYAAIIHNDPTQSRFANGWFIRLFAFLT